MESLLSRPLCQPSDVPSPHHYNPASGKAECIDLSLPRTQGLTTRKIRATRMIREQLDPNTSTAFMTKQNVTISLTRQTLQKVRVLAARRATSISGLLAEQVEILVGEEEAYDRAQRQAMTLLDKGFHMGGVIRASRDELHER